MFLLQQLLCLQSAQRLDSLSRTSVFPLYVHYRCFDQSKILKSKKIGQQGTFHFSIIFQVLMGTHRQKFNSFSNLFLAKQSLPPFILVGTRFCALTLLTPVFALQNVKNMLLRLSFLHIFFLVYTHCHNHREFQIRMFVLTSRWYVIWPGIQLILPALKRFYIEMFVSGQWGCAWQSVLHLARSSLCVGDCLDDCFLSVLMDLLCQQQLLP